MSTSYHAATQPTPLSALLGKTKVCEQLGLSERTLENMVRANAFPPPVRIGKCVYWSELAVRRWQEQKFAAQEAWLPRVR